MVPFKYPPLCSVVSVYSTLQSLPHTIVLHEFRHFSSIVLFISRGWIIGSSSNINIVCCICLSSPPFNVIFHMRLIHPLPVVQHYWYHVIDLFRILHLTNLVLCDCFVHIYWIKQTMYLYPINTPRIMPTCRQRRETVQIDQRFNKIEVIL